MGESLEQVKKLPEYHWYEYGLTPPEAEILNVTIPLGATVVDPGLMLPLNVGAALTVNVMLLLTVVVGELLSVTNIFAVHVPVVCPAGILNVKLFEVA